MLLLLERNYVRDTLRSGLCYHKSVCRLSITFVRPTQGVETFCNISSPFCTLAILWPMCKILRTSSHGKPSVGVVKRKSCSKIERRHVRLSHLHSGGLTMRQWRHEPPAPNFWAKKIGQHSDSVQIFEVINLYNRTV